MRRKCRRDMVGLSGEGGIWSVGGAENGRREMFIFVNDTASTEIYTE